MYRVGGWPVALIFRFGVALHLVLAAFGKVRVISAHSVSNAVVLLFPDDIFCPGKPSAANCK